MIAPVSNHWKLGLFVSLVIGLGLISLIALGATQMDRERIPVVTFFDETVQGLDVGSPLKWRGVPIGGVTAIGVAPDNRMVEVHLDVYSDLLTKFGGNVEKLRDLTAANPLRSRMPTDVRVRLVSAGITGLKFIELDVVKDAPPIDVKFELPPNYIPSAPSVMAGLEMGVAKTVEMLPQLLASIDHLVNSIDTIVGDMRDAKLAETLGHALATVDEVLQGLKTDEAGDRLGGIATQLEATLTEARATIVAIGDASRSVNAQLVAADPAATAASLRGAADTFTVLGEEFGAPGASLGAQISALRETLDRAKELLELITRQPDAFLSGRSLEPAPSR